MSRPADYRRPWLSWLFLSALLILCGALGVLQYQWIGDVSFAARERLRSSLQTNLVQLRRDFDTELMGAIRMLMPPPPGFAIDGPPLESALTEPDYTQSYLKWNTASSHPRLVRSVGRAIPHGSAAVTLRLLDFQKKTFIDAEWPAHWKGLHERFLARLQADPWERRGPRRLPDVHQGLLFEIPRFAPPLGVDSSGRPRRRETEWLIVEFDRDYIRDVYLPELLDRHLGASGRADYQVQVEATGSPGSTIYQSDDVRGRTIAATADASVGLFPMFLGRPGGPGGTPGLGRGSPMEDGLWRLSVRHRAGSLEALVSRARVRNIAVTAVLLSLILLTAVTLVRYTRRAQRLAEMQMNFVAGISHEFRTPLTVIHTSAYNLRGRVAANPSHVERYGVMIREEAEKLTALVEQVLRFGSANAGQVIQERKPISVEAVIEDGLDASRSVLEESHCTLEKQIDPGLPLILGDAAALRHAIRNLLSNAAKYGTETSNWIGITAARNDGAVEIRVADRGRGIPHDEQSHIFEPFYRGKRALQDQIRGTGLGLSLVKAIIEAHQGAVVVRSDPQNGTEFVIRIPAAPPEYDSEFTDSRS